MKTVVRLEIELSDQQAADFAAWAKIPDSPPRMKDVVEQVRGYVLAVTDRAFDGVGSGAEVTLK